MGWQFTLLSTPILLGLVISLFLCGYILTIYREGRGDPLIILYFWVTVAAIIWTGFSALKLLHTDPATKLLFYRFLHIGAGTLPPLLFLFVLVYTDRTHWLRYETVGAVFLIPTVFIVLLFSEPDGLVIAGTRIIENELVILRVTDGPVFLVFSLYSTLLVVATLGIILLEIRRFGPTYYPQASLLAIAVITPIVFTLLTMAGIPPFADDRINLVPTSAAISVGAFGLLLHRYRLIDLPPLAYVTAMKYTPDALFVLDQEEQVIHTNEHGEDLLEDVNGSMGSPFSASLPEFNPETMANELIEITAPSGELTYHRVFVEPLRRGGRRIGWVVVLRDETEQQRQQRRLERKNEQMELLASTISHDIKNPLSVANGYLEIAQDEFESEQLDKVESAHTRIEEIIDEVMALARAGKQIDDLEAVPLDDLVESTWGNVATPKAELSVDVDRTIMADPTMIQHVFENLFRNAVEHGGENVTVTVGTLPDGFYIEDDGVGIPPKDREEIFDIGYSTSAEGTGFGLVITQQIVEAHKWEIQVTEAPTGGTRFEFRGVEFAE